MKMKSIMVLMTILASSITSLAVNTDYYFEASCYNADAEISINGNTVFKTDPNSTSTSKSITSWATPVLTAGNVDVSVRYINRQGADMTSKVDFSISSCPNGSARSNAVVLLEDCIKSEIFHIDPNSTDITLLNGIVDDDARFIFEVIDDVNDIDQALRIHLNNDIFKWQPTSLKYCGLSGELENGVIRFEKGQTYPLGGNRADIYVEQSFTELIEMGDEYELNNTTGSSTNVTDCNTITIYGQVTDNPTKPIKCGDLLIMQVLKNEVQKTYTLSIPSANIPTWSWESGTDISNISQSQEDDLWDTIVALRATMDGATDPNELLPVFEEKTVNLALGLYATTSALESQQMVFFTSYLNDSNWGMKSINRADLSYYNINSKLIKVEGTDGVTLFESDPLSASFGGNTYKIDVYFALISNEWKIVR